jgi:NADH-quinone oxidoreductase subunit L
MVLAIPSVVIGAIAIGPMLFGEFFKDVIKVNTAAHPAMGKLAEHWEQLSDNMPGWLGMAVHSVLTPVFWLALAGVASAWFVYLRNPHIATKAKRMFAPLYTLLENKYYMDRINEVVFAGGSLLLGRGLWKRGDQQMIDGALVNGSARAVGWIASVVRYFQTGYIYHYAFAMILGVLVLLTFFARVIAVN